MAQPVPFGRYQLLDTLAVGGMAELFLAKAIGEGGFEKLCVVKRVLPHLAKSPGFIDMFLDEARLAARLIHPGIVQIFDLGRSGEDYYLAMEYLPGEDLSKVQGRLAELKTAMPVEVALRVAALAAEALHFAHELGDEAGAPLRIVHRDVSPSNLLVTYQGQVKLLDFGIARAEQRMRTTEVGLVKGKAGYIAPEQAHGLTVDRRADVWSLGVCLHEMLAGAPLFDHEGSLATLNALLHKPIPSLSALRPEIPAALDAAVLGALERDRERRYPSAEAFRAALLPFLREVDLAAFMRATFGVERERERTLLRALRSSPQKGTLVRTATLGEVSAPPSGEPITLEERPFWRRPRYALAALGIAGVLAAVLAFPRRPTLRALATMDAAVLETQAPTAALGSRPPEDARGPARAAESAEPRPSAPTPVRRHVGPHPGRSSAAPPAATGALSVRTNLPCSVEVDGVSVGASPLAHVKIAAGARVVTLKNPALGISKALSVKVAPGGEAVVEQSFQKGFLNVLVTPWADVYLDGERIGQTPLARREVWEGLHQVRLVGPGSERTVRVAVEPGKVAIVREALQ